MRASGLDRAKCRVVVVEDEVLTRMAAGLALTEAGFEAVEVNHADAALEHLQRRAEQIHALFADIHCPGTMDGLTLAHHCRRHWPWIVLLVVSGLARPRSMTLPGGCRFLPKPYDPDHAIRHLREMLADAESPAAS